VTGSPPSPKETRQVSARPLPNLVYEGGACAAAAAVAAALAAHALSALEGLPHLHFPSWGFMLLSAALLWACLWAVLLGVCKNLLLGVNALLIKSSSPSSLEPPLCLPLSLLGTSQEWTYPLKDVESSSLQAHIWLTQAEAAQAGLPLRDICLTPLVDPFDDTTLL